MTTTKNGGFSKSENFQSTMSSLNYGHVMERAARDYQKEILEKEKFSGLHISSYIFSKIGFLSTLVFLQSIWMGVFVQICIPSLPGNIITRLIILLLVNASMTSICLGISGMMRNPEQSSLLSIYLVGFQLPLSGAILALPDWISPITQPLISGYWAWSGSLDSMKG